MFLRRAGLGTAATALAAGGLVGGGTGAPTGTAPGVRIEHAPPDCALAERTLRLVACLDPRSTAASLQIVFRADDATEEYRSAMRSDTPCHSGLLPRPSRSTARVFYRIEAEASGATARSPDHVLAVVADAASCPGKVAPVSRERARALGPAGAPRTPPGFEGTTAPTATARAARPSSPAAAPAPPKPPTPPPSAGPRPPVSPPPSPAAAPSGGGHGLRNTVLVGLGLAGAGGAAVALAREEEPAGPAGSGSGLPASGVSGVYVGTETLAYPGGCTGTDDIVLNLQESGGSVTGVLTFTVRSCACCSAGRGANPVSGRLAGTNLDFSTPVGFSYSGAFAADRLSGALAGPGGVTGTWTVDKR